MLQIIIHRAPKPRFNSDICTAHKSSVGFTGDARGAFHRNLKIFRNFGGRNFLRVRIMYD